MTRRTDPAETTAAADGFTLSWIAQDIARKATFLTDDLVLWNNAHRVDVSCGQTIRYFKVGCCAECLDGTGLPDLG